MNIARHTGLAHKSKMRGLVTADVKEVVVYTTFCETNNCSIQMGSRTNGT